MVSKVPGLSSSRLSQGEARELFCELFPRSRTISQNVVLPLSDFLAVCLCPCMSLVLLSSLFPFASTFEPAGRLPPSDFLEGGSALL